MFLEALRVKRPGRDDRLHRALVLAGERGPPDPGAYCLDDETVAGLVDGTLGPPARMEAVTHLARCEVCRTAVASVAQALADPSVSAEVRRLGRQGRSPSRLALSAAAAAAAAVILLVSWPPAPPDETELTHRAPTITAGAAPAPVAPVGVVNRARTLRWAAVDGADRYRVTLFDAAGQVLYEVETAGASAALPDSVPLTGGRRYLWKVEARLGFDRWSASELVEFSLAPGASP